MLFFMFLDATESHLWSFYIFIGLAGGMSVCGHVEAESLHRREKMCKKSTLVILSPFAVTLSAAKGLQFARSG